MKGMDGFELAIQIKKKESENSKPIIFITAQAIDKAKNLKAMTLAVSII